MDIDNESVQMVICWYNMQNSIVLWQQSFNEMSMLEKCRKYKCSVFINFEYISNATVTNTYFPTQLQIPIRK